MLTSDPASAKDARECASRDERLKTLANYKGNEK